MFELIPSVIWGRFYGGSK